MKVEMLKDLEIVSQELIALNDEYGQLKVLVDFNCRFTTKPLLFVIIPGYLSEMQCLS